MPNTRKCERCGYVFRVGDNVMIYFESWQRCPYCQSMNTTHRPDLINEVNQNEKGEILIPFMDKELK